MSLERLEVELSAVLVGAGGGEVTGVEEVDDVLIVFDVLVWVPVDEADSVFEAEDGRTGGTVMPSARRCSDKRAITLWLPKINNMKTGNLIEGIVETKS